MKRSWAAALVPSLELRRSHAVAPSAAVCSFLLLSVLLGGSSGAGFTANAILQVAAIIALATTIAFGPPRTGGYSAAERQLHLLCGLFAALFIFQLIPLPAFVWTVLPGRKMVADGFTALGTPLPWLSLSLAPERTLYSALSLLTPFAMILMLGAFRRMVAEAAILALLLAVILSVLVGVAQVSGTHALYFYAYTNENSAVGFFANSNHFGTLMCVTMPLVTGLVSQWRRGPSAKTSSRLVSAAVLLAVMLMTLLGITMTKSVAATLLGLLALSGSAVITLAGLSNRLRLGFLAGVIVVLVIAAGIAFANGTNDLIALDVSGSGLSRSSMWHTTLPAIATFGPAGAGFGSFPQIFHLFENAATVDATFANHAHNDLLEFALEGGIPGIVLLVAFFAWFTVRFLSVWMSERRRDPVMQGASIAVLIILLHSLVDYPMRTAAIAAVFGLSLSLLSRPLSGEKTELFGSEDQKGRHISA